MFDRELKEWTALGQSRPPGRGRGETCPGTQPRGPRPPHAENFSEQKKKREGSTFPEEALFFYRYGKSKTIKRAAGA
jgi:hypothetical protein